MGICAEGTMVTLSGNAVLVNFGTLREGAGKSGWNMTAGNEWIRNQRPALVTPYPSVTNETKVIWIGKIDFGNFF